MSPFQVTDDQLFDLSKYIEVGENRIRMHYPYGKPSEWVFAVLLHSPTPVQRAVLENRRMRDVEWKNTLGRLRTLTVPPLEWPDSLKPIPYPPKS